MLLKFEIDLGDSKKNDELFKSLRQLITILFAIVIGSGFIQLKRIFIKIDFFNTCA
jgi:hypothetical protein